MRETLAAIAATLAVLVALGQIDPNMTIGEFVNTYSPVATEQEEIVPEIEIAVEAETPIVETVEAQPETPEATVEEFVIIIEDEPKDEAAKGATLEEQPAEETAPVIMPEVAVEPEISVLYTEKDAKALASVMHAEARGLSNAQKEAVGWVVLNRSEAWNRSIQSVVSESGAFVRSSYYSDEELALANQVLSSWANDGPRILPEGYLYFWGDGNQNYFRKDFSSKEKYEVL